MKNTWGTDFGMDGYLQVCFDLFDSSLNIQNQIYSAEVLFFRERVQIAVGKNLCGIAEEVSSIQIRG